jgi:hypothetical protein
VEGGSRRGKAIGAVIRALCEAERLPAPGDTEAMIPPTGRGFVRRVPGENLWVWYRPRADHLTILCVTSAPPVAVDD